MSKKQNYKNDPTTPKVLKVRCGDPRGGGKGALANENQAFTLAVTNDQVLFQPVKPKSVRGGRYVMTEYHPNDSRMKIDESGTCQTLTSRMGTGGNNVPCVVEVLDE